MFDLTGRIALVTGASGSLGSAIAKALHRQGATLALHGTRVSALEKLRNELGERASIFVCDLFDRVTRSKLVPRVIEQFGRIDILVNNAGITRDALVMRMRDKDWDDVINLNLTACFELARACLRGMIKSRFGRIISISSIAGTVGNVGQANYAASKAGLVGMSKSLAREVAGRGVTANCVAPGLIESSINDALDGKQRQAILDTIPMKRLGLTEEVAAAVVYFASTEAAYVTGEILQMNGGTVTI